MIRILDRLMTLSFLRVFLAFILGAPILFVLGDITENLEGYLDQELTGLAITKAYLFMLPQFIQWSFPIAALVGVVFTIQSMTMHREIVAAKAGGISFHRLIVPVLSMGILLTGVALVLSAIVPRANTVASEILQRFQHLRLNRDVDLLLIDGSRVLEEEALLPKGRLREPLSAIARADAVVITREHLSPNLKQLVKEIRTWNLTAPIFPFSHEIDEIYDLQDGTRYPLSKLQGCEVVVLAGIGEPTQFLKDLQRAGIIVKDQILYPDHHNYSQAELDQALDRREKSKTSYVLTTEKDAVRLRGLESGLHRVLVVSIKAKARDPASFINWVLQKLEKSGT